MANDEPSATSLDALSTEIAVPVTFHAGLTAGGHHWDVHGPDGAVLARTRRVHQGGGAKRALFSTVTLLGLDAGNDIHVELVGANDTVLLRASSINEAPATVTVTDPSGATLCRATNAGGTLTIADAGGQALATVPHDGDGPWPVLGPDGTPLGELVAGQPGPGTTQSVREMLAPIAPTDSSDVARTMHLGLRRVLSYTLVRAETETRLPLGVALAPLLAGLTY